MTLQRYRAVQRKLPGKTAMERDAELVRFIRVGHNTNLLAYASLRDSGLNQQWAEYLMFTTSGAVVIFDSVVQNHLIG
jgi:hypothetical protein